MSVNNLSSLQFHEKPFSPKLKFVPGHHDAFGHRITAHDPSTGNQIGYMVWHPQAGTINHVSVEGGYQRRGVATSMWNEANRLASAGTSHTCTDGLCSKTHAVVAPKHSSGRTNEGDAWARKVGGDLPRTFGE